MVNIHNDKKDIELNTGKHDITADVPSWHCNNDNNNDNSVKNKNKDENNNSNNSKQKEVELNDERNINYNIVSTIIIMKMIFNMSIH